MSRPKRKASREAQHPSTYRQRSDDGQVTNDNLAVMDPQSVVHSALPATFAASTFGPVYDIPPREIWSLRQPTIPHSLSSYANAIYNQSQPMGTSYMPPAPFPLNATATTQAPYAHYPHASSAPWDYSLSHLNPQFLGSPAVISSTASSPPRSPTPVGLLTQFSPAYPDTTLSHDVYRYVQGTHEMLPPAGTSSYGAATMGTANYHNLPMPAFSGATESPIADPTLLNQPSSATLYMHSNVPFDQTMHWPSLPAAADHSQPTSVSAQAPVQSTGVQLLHDRDLAHPPSADRKGKGKAWMDKVNGTAMNALSVATAATEFCPPAKTVFATIKEVLNILQVCAHASI